jgi:hypothetical protein
LKRGGVVVKLRIAVVILPLAVGLAATMASAQQDGPFQCIASSTAGGQITMYVSQLIPSGGAKPSAAINGAWGDYVKATYHLDTVSTALCNALPADPSIQQRIVAAEQNAWQKKNIQLVQVNWQPGQKQNPEQNANTNPYTSTQAPADAGGKGAPAADNQNAQNAPTQDQGPAPRASYCFSDQKKPTIYFSDAFDSADIQNPDDWVNAFIKMLVDKYKYKGSVTCNDTDTIFNAQGAIRDLKDSLTGKQLVDTDWTYEPPAHGDAPAAVADTPAPAPAAKKKTSAAKPAPQN